MARAPFDTLFWVFAYPTGGTWGSPIAGPYNGRLVPQDRIIPGSGPVDDCFWWLTTDAVLGTPSRTFAPGDLTLSCDMTLARGVAVGNASNPSFIVLQVYLVIEPSQGLPYYRYLLMATPF